MPINQEAGIKGAPKSLYQIPAVEHQLRSRNSLAEQEQSVEGLLEAVESLQRIVCELLLQNQMLRMDRETGPHSSTTRILNAQRLESQSFF